MVQGVRFYGAAILFSRWTRSSASRGVSPSGRVLRSKSSAADQAGPGDRRSVKSRGAAADLVENDKGTRTRLVQDRRGLDHLDHKGRAAARQIVGRADPAEEVVDDAHLGGPGGDIGAHLRQNGDQRVLPQKRALAGDVRAVTSQVQSSQTRNIGDKLAACRSECRLDC